MIKANTDNRYTITFVVCKIFFLVVLTSTPVKASLLSVNESFCTRQTNVMSGNGGEVLLNRVIGSADDGTVAGDGHTIQRLDVGDRLAGIGQTLTVECLASGISRDLGADEYNLKTALRAFEVISKVSDASGFHFTFGSLTPLEYSETIQVASGGALAISVDSIPEGTMILSFDDPTPSFTVETVPGSPGANWTEATNGIRHWSVGIGRPTDFWMASFPTDDLGLLPMLPSSVEVGTISFGLSLLSGHSGFSEIIPSPCIGPSGIVSVDFCLSGKAVGTADIDTPFPIGLKTEITFHPVPEPEAVQLLLLGVLGITFFTRSRTS